MKGAWPNQSVMWGAGDEDMLVRGILERFRCSQAGMGCSSHLVKHNFIMDGLQEHLIKLSSVDWLHSVFVFKFKENFAKQSAYKVGYINHFWPLPITTDPFESPICCPSGLGPSFFSCLVPLRQLRPSSYSPFCSHRPQMCCSHQVSCCCSLPMRKNPEAHQLFEINNH